MLSHYLTTTDPDETFAVLEDSPEGTMLRVNPKAYREAIDYGFAKRNALALATQAPFRVTQGFGAFENFATLEAAIEYANEMSEHWVVKNGRRNAGYAYKRGEMPSYDICGPTVEDRRRMIAGEAEYPETIHDPCHGEFYAEPVKVEVAS